MSSENKTPEEMAALRGDMSKAVEEASSVFRENLSSALRTQPAEAGGAVAAAIEAMPVPVPHTNSWQLGYMRARKDAADIARSALVPTPAPQGMDTAVEVEPMEWQRTRIQCLHEHPDRYGIPDAHEYCRKCGGRVDACGWVHKPVTSPQPAPSSADAGMLAALREERDRYREGLQTLACTFYKEDQHQDYARHVLAAASASPVQPEAEGWQDMKTAPRDGTIVELRSALSGNPAIFKAGYVRPRGLIAQLWCPVRDQKVGAMPWKDSEVDAWRPAAPKQGGE